MSAVFRAGAAGTAPFFERRKTGGIRRGLREMELSVTPEADYSVEQKADVKESGQPKPGKVKKAAQPERE